MDSKAIQRAPRGTSLAIMMILALVCVTLSFTLSALASFQLNAAQKAQTNEQALSLAEGAIAQAMARLRHGMDAGATQFGRSGETIRYAPDVNRPDAAGVVSFDPSTPWGYSTNNFDGAQGAGWNGVPVPQGAARLIGRGMYGSSLRTVEAFVTIPQYQYVLACDGPISTHGPLIARAETSMTAFVAGAQNGGAANTSLPANVGSNAGVGAGMNSLITGDVVCSGTVDIANPSSIGGAVRQGVVAVPHLKVVSYGNDGPTTPHLSANPAGDVELTANTYAPQSVKLSGNLKLDGCTLYVDGNLSVPGGITGTGAVFVHGNVVVDGGADLDAANLVALLATGDVTLHGPPAAQKYFQGLVYSEGAFYASNITVAGAMVIPQSDETTSSHPCSLSLGNNVQVVYVPSAVSIPGVAATPTPSPAGTPQSVIGSIATVWQAVVVPPGQQPARAGVTSASTQNWSPNGISPDSPTDTPIFNAVMAAIASDPNANLLNGVGNGVAYGGVNLYIYQIWNSKKLYQIFVEADQYDPATNRFVAINPPIVWCQALPGVPMSVAQMDAILAAPQTGIPVTNPTNGNVTVEPNPGLNVNALVALQVKAQTAFMNAANQILSRGGPGGPRPGPGRGPLPATMPALLLNTFLEDQSPLHIVSWRER